MTINETFETGPNWTRMARAIRFLSENYLNQPSLDDAAAAAGLSPSHFQREFTRHVGVSPKTFVAHLTLARAKAELAQGATQLQAALEAGLSGPSRLYDLCLKFEAMTPGDYAKGGAGLTIDYGFAESPFGRALAMTTAKGLCGLAFGDEGEDEAMFTDMQRRWPKAAYRRNDERAAGILEQIFGKGERELTLHLLGTAWQIKVWQALLAIPPGQVTSYRTIAQRVCTPRASRAVGAAVGRNPISYLIPCHRVLATSGALTGYHWGLTRKRSMLALEAARLATP